MGFLDILGPVGSFVTSGLGFISDRNNRKSQEAINAQNIALQREMNAQNQKNFETELQFSRDTQKIQQDFQREMFDKTNAYNDPSAQRQRLEAAGLNPYLMMSGGSAGTATSQSGASASTPGAPQLQAPHLVAPEMQLQNFGAVIDALTKLSQRKQVDAATQNLRIEGQYKALEMMGRIAESHANARNTKAKAIYQEIANNFAETMQKSTLANMNAQTQAIRQQTRGTILDNVSREINLQFLPHEKRLQLGNMAADIGEKVVRKELTVKQGVTELAKAAGIRLDNKVKRDTFESVVGKAASEWRRAQNNEGADSPWKLGTGLLQGSSEDEAEAAARRNMRETWRKLNGPA